jgi:hypothetical protein
MRGWRAEKKNRDPLFERFTYREGAGAPRFLLAPAKPSESDPALRPWPGHGWRLRQLRPQPLTLIVAYPLAPAAAENP